MLNCYKCFIKMHGINISNEQVDRNPNVADNNWQANHYKTTLKTNKCNCLVVYFSKGIGLTGEPTVEEVLECLASDAAGIENARNFEDWCWDYGYNDNDPRARKIYNVTKGQSEKLKQFLGDDAYEILLWKIAV